MQSSLSNPKNIDRINIFLVFVSLAIAIKIPFELFLFSYAFLGPLHYLTEINWLKDREYFFKKSKNWIFFFIACCILISIYPLFKYLDSILNTQYSKDLVLVNKIGSRLTAGALLLSIVLVSVKKWTYRTLFIILIAAVIFLVDTKQPSLFNFIGMLLPTLVHVYVFTLLFVLFGARKSDSKPGYILTLIILAIPIIIANLNIPSKPLVLEEETRNNFITTNMQAVSSIVTNWFSPVKRNIYSIAIKVQIFISFAYTYHYLNWFSKTSIIGWQKTLKGKKVYLILGFWLISILLYYIDFKLGFIILFFLSFLHVLLEFPLNIVTIKELISIKKGVK